MMSTSSLTALGEATKKQALQGGSLIQTRPHFHKSLYSICKEHECLAHHGDRSDRGKDRDDLDILPSINGEEVKPSLWRLSGSS